jgi:hypothetical protein
MPDWKGIVAKSFTPEAFARYCATLQWTDWRPAFIVLHNTETPSLAQCPEGLTVQHLLALEAYYRDTMHWSAAPHLFIDDKQIWVFTALTESGIHSPSWNKVSLGVEMLGDFEQEAFDSGRGLAVQRNTIGALAILSTMLGIDCRTMRIHREDPLTTHRCPGKHVSKQAVIEAVSQYQAANL